MEVSFKRDCKFLNNNYWKNWFRNIDSNNPAIKIILSGVGN